MNRYNKALGFTAAIMLSGCASAIGPQWPAGEDPPEIAIGVYRQPSPGAELMYRVLAAELAVRRGYFDAAMENYQVAAQMSADSRVLERAVGLALSVGNNAVALQLARDWYALDPDDSQARLAMALALLRNEQVAEAVDYLEMIRRDAASRDEQEGFAALNALFAQLEDDAVVFRALEALRERHPQSLFAHYYYALAALELDQEQRALESLDEALAQNPKWAPGHLLRAHVMMEVGESEAALTALEKAVKEVPDHRELRTGYARLLAGAGRLEEARDQFQILAEQYPQDTEALFMLGLLAAEAEDYDQAVSYYKKVLGRGVRVMDVYYELGRIEELRGDYRKARDWYGRVAEGERHLSAQVRLGAVLGKLGDYAAMAAHFDAMRRDYPQNAVSLYLAEAEILREEERYRALFDLLSDALREYPEDHDLLYARALAAEKIDRVDILEQDLRTLIEADPENAHALNALGYTLADRTDRYQEALEYIRRAMELLPEDAAVLDSMGWVMYRLGNYEESLKYLRQAYQLSADPEIASHLSEVLWVSNRLNEARDVWQRAIEAHPNDPYLLKVKDRFDL